MRILRHVKTVLLKICVSKKRNSWKYIRGNRVSWIRVSYIPLSSRLRLLMFAFASGCGIPSIPLIEYEGRWRAEMSDPWIPSSCCCCCCCWPIGCCCCWCWPGCCWPCACWPIGPGEWTPPVPPDPPVPAWVTMEGLCVPLVLPHKLVLAFSAALFLTIL